MEFNRKKNKVKFSAHCSQVAWWSRGMIRASGARGPGFNSRPCPIFFLCYAVISSEEIGDYVVTTVQPYGNGESTIQPVNTTELGNNSSSSSLSLLGKLSF